MTSHATISRRVVAAPVGAVADTVRAAGSFFALTLDTFVLLFTRPLAWREFITQTWFVARVSMAPAMLLAIVFVAFATFTFNLLVGQLGLADTSGTLAALGTVTQMAPVVNVFVVAGAGATAMCADLGARTIREELDAMRVMGINPLQALVVPRVLASGLVAVMLLSVVIIIGLTGSFLFSVFIQNVSPGAYIGGLTLLTGLQDVFSALFKGLLSGIAAGLIACYKGMSVSGGPQGVGNAVHETVIYTFVVLFVINLTVTGVIIVVFPA